MRALLLVVCCLSLRAAIVAPEEQLPVGSLLEWRNSTAWTAGTALPFLDLRLPDGQELRLPGFVRQDLQWHADEPQALGPEYLAWRFLPLQAGTLAWRVRQGDTVLGQGYTEVSPSAGNHGPLRIHAHNRRLLATHNGNAQILIGANIAWANAPQRLETYLRYIDQLSAAGGNHLRLWCAAWMGQIAAPGQDGHWRLDQADVLDQIFAHALSRGVYITLVLDNYHDWYLGDNGNYGPSTMERFHQFFADPLPAQYRDRLDYLTARYAAWPNLAAWELFNEIDEGLRQPGFSLPYPERVWGAARWIGAAAQALRARDPYQHLITSSCATAEARALVQHPALDLLQVHQYIPVLKDIEAQHQDGAGLLSGYQESLLQDGRPWLIGEVGFQGTNDHNDGHLADPDGRLLRHTAWAGLLLGGYGSGMNWWWDVYIDAHQLWPAYTPLARAVAALNWDDPQLTPRVPGHGESFVLYGWQSPSQALLWPHLRANAWPNAEPVPYRGQSVVLDGLIPQGRYQSRLITLDNGIWHELPPLTASPEGLLLITLPAGQPESAIVVRLAPDLPSSTPTP